MNSSRHTFTEMGSGQGEGQRPWAAHMSPTLSRFSVEMRIEGTSLIR